MSTPHFNRIVHRVILHVDMDAFYASVEQRDVPSYRGRPVIVGGSPQQRGVVCAASYEARAFGVRSAMPSVTAGKLCPQGVFVRPRMTLYRQESKAIMEILRSLGGVIEQVSVDEAYLDLSDSLDVTDHDGALLEMVSRARELKARIRRERGLAASVGIAANKMLAKLASDYGKPDGLLLIPERDKIVFLRSLPVGRIHGVGKVTAGQLESVGLKTIGDLQDYQGRLESLVGSWGQQLRRFAFGEDDRPVHEDDTVKSMSCETTFARDTEDRPVLRETLRELAAELSESLRKRTMRARTVQVKVRYADFRTLTRQLSLENPVDEAAFIYRAACHLLARDRLVSSPLRLLGLGVSGLVESPCWQLEFPFSVPSQ